MGDPVPSSAIYDATTGGRSVIVITGGSTGQVLTLQSDGTYAPATVSAGISGSVGSTDNRIVRSDGTGGTTVKATGITVDDSNNVSGLTTIDLSGQSLSGSQTTSQVSLTSTWNTSGIATQILSNLTDTASATASCLIDNRVGGVSQFAIRKNYPISDGTSAWALVTRGVVCGLYYGNAAICMGPGASNSFVVFGGSSNNLAIGPTATTFAKLIKVGVYTVATLPSASANAGAEAQVTDSSITTFRSTVAGGGSNRVRVFSDGTNWLVI